MLIGWIGLSPAATLLFRAVAEADTIPQGNGKPDVSVAPGDLVFASFKNAMRDVRLMPLSSLPIY